MDWKHPNAFMRAQARYDDAMPPEPEDEPPLVVCQDCGLLEWETEMIQHMTDDLNPEATCCRKCFQKL